MKKNDVTKFFKNIGRSVSKRSPEILIGMGITGMITTTVLAVKATPKALELIEEEKRKRIKEATIEEAREWADAGGVKISPVDYVKLCWKPYTPAVVTCAFSAACIIGASSKYAKRNAALATAYKLSTTALSDYKEKVVETIGEKKAKDIRDKVVQDKVEKKEVTTPKSNVIESVKDVIFHDMAFGQTFYSDVESIRKAVNDFNYEMLTGQYGSLNDFYDLLGIERIDIGNSLGWNISRDGQLEVSCDRTSVTKDGRPCYVLEYHKAPEYDYYKL